MDQVILNEAKIEARHQRFLYAEAYFAVGTHEVDSSVDAWDDQ